MNEPDVIYLLQPCSDSDGSRLWCQDPITCKEFGGPHAACRCAGKGEEPTKYVKADRLQRAEELNRELSMALREAVLWDGYDEEGVESVWLSLARAALDKMGERND